jgi:hypothetical protein
VEAEVDAGAGVDVSLRLEDLRVCGTAAAVITS